MGEPFEHGIARAYVRAILDGTGITTFTGPANDSMTHDGMTSVDVVNVLRGGRIRGSELVRGQWRYRSETNQMGVEFGFRGHEADPERIAPNEVVVIKAWRGKR